MGIMYCKGKGCRQLPMVCELPYALVNPHIGVHIVCTGIWRVAARLASLHWHSWIIDEQTPLDSVLVFVDI